MRSPKGECVSRMIFLGERSLRETICHFVEHCHQERIHRGLGNRLIEPNDEVGSTIGNVQCRERLGGSARNLHLRRAEIAGPLHGRRRRRWITYDSAQHDLAPYATTTLRGGRRGTRLVARRRRAAKLEDAVRVGKLLCRGSSRPSAHGRRARSDSPVRGARDRVGGWSGVQMGWETDRDARMQRWRDLGSK